MPRLVRLLAMAAVLLGGIAVAPAASADQEAETQGYDLPSAPTDFTSTVLVDRFDPDRGELVGVDLRLDGDLQASVRVEDIGAEPATATSTATGRLRLTRAGSAWAVEVAGSGVQTDALDTFDGEIDFGGASGRTTALALDAAAVTVGLTTAEDLAPFIGTGTLALDVQGTGAVATTSSGAPLATGSSVSAGGRLEVTYHFHTDTRPPDPPTITARPPLFTNDPTPTIAFTAEAGAATTCRLDVAGVAGPWQPCTSPWTVDLGAAASGPHTMSVRATDAAGNVGEPAGASFTVDLVVPGPPVIVGLPVSPSPVTDPSWSFVSDADTTTTCEIDDLGATPCALTYTAALAGLADGPHVLEVVATDAAGNVGPAATATYVLDRQPPGAPAFASSPTSPDSDPTPSWTIVAEVGSTIACAVDDGPFVACEPAHTVDLTAAADGPHTLRVRAADAAGNAGPVATATYVLDRQGPAAPAVEGPPPIGNDSTVTWTFTGEGGARFECQLDLAPLVACDDGRYDATLEVDGVHTFSVRAVDVAGNPGATTTSTYTLDRVAPPPPSITGRPADPSPDDNPTWTFTLGGTMRTAECRIDGGPWRACTTPATFDLGAAADGAHTFEVRAIDRAGNIGEPTLSAYVLDRASPASPTIDQAPATPGAGLAPTWTFAGPGDAVLECSTAAAGPWVICTSPRTVELAPTAADGPVDLFVRARDEAGNTSAAASSTYVLDRTPPSTPTITAAPDTPANRTSAAWTFEVDVDAEAECALDGGPWGACAGGFVAVFAPGSDGPHTFAVRAVDEAGNASAAAAGAYVLDTTPPPAPSITGGPAGASTDDTPAWTIAGEPGATLECRADDGAFAPCADLVELDLRAAADGTHSLEVRATDAVGNTGPVAASAYLLDRAAPTAPTFVTAPPSPSVDRAPTWTFTTEPGATTECALDGADPVPCDGELVADLTDAEDGEHVLVVRARDAAGNVSPETLGVVVLDTTAPAAPVVTGPSSPGHERTPSWHVAVDADAGVECAVDDGEFETCGALLQIELADGAHRIVVRAVDAAGNRSVAVTIHHVVDTVVPDPPRITHQPSPAAWSWGVAAPPGAGVECSIDGGPWTPCGAVVPAGTGNASPRLDVRSVDAAGNRSAVVSSGPAPLAAAVPEAPPAPTRTPPSPTLAPSPGSTASLAAAALPPLSVPVLPGAAAAPVAATAETAVAATHRPVVVPAGPETALGNLLPVLPPEVAQAIQTAVQRSTLPAVLVVVVIAFLAIQDRVDRRDPKLAQAPLRAEPEYLEFR